MFSGIIHHIGTIESADLGGDLRITVACDFSDFRIGESIACNGACLTVVEASGKTFAADLSAETIACTAPGQWEKGRAVNLERALKVGDALDGHMVSGHVDGLAVIKTITPSGDSHLLELQAPPEFLRFIAEKGSVTLDGVSLTVNKVAGERFWVNIIPHTWTATTLGKRRPGESLNLEIDLIARTVARLLNT